MRPQPWTRLTVGAGFCLVALTNFAAPAPEQNLDRTFNVAPGGKFVLQADHGSIAVHTDGSDAVRVRVLREAKNANEKQAAELFANHEVTFTQDGSSITVTARNKSKKLVSWGRQPWLEIHYEVNLPKKFNVDLNTAGGDIHVEALEGDAVARTSSGSIQLPSVTGKVEAKNAGGDISIGNAAPAAAGRNRLRRSLEGETTIACKKADRPCAAP